MRLKAPVPKDADRERAARRLERAAEQERALGLREESRKTLDLAAGIRQGALSPTPTVWQHFRIGVRPSSEWIAEHKRAMTWLARCAAERGDRPPVCDLPCGGKYCR
jgi:hypothetical protein